VSRVQPEEDVGHQEVAQLQESLEAQHQEEADWKHQLEAVRHVTQSAEEHGNGEQVHWRHGVPKPPEPSVKPTPNVEGIVSVVGQQIWMYLGV